MTERPSETHDEQHNDSAPISSLSGTERMFVRLTLWQTVLSVAGVIVAIVALYAALSESAAVRHQTEAAVWPFVQFSIDDYDSADEASFTMRFTNAGVGPARRSLIRKTRSASATARYSIPAGLQTVASFPVPHVRGTCRADQPSNASLLRSRFSAAELPSASAVVTCSASSSARCTSRELRGV